MNRAFPARIGVDVWILKFWAQIPIQIGPVADIETHPTEMRKVSLFALSVQFDAVAPGGRARGSSR